MAESSAHIVTPNARQKQKQIPHSRLVFGRAVADGGQHLVTLRHLKHLRVRIGEAHDREDLMTGSFGAVTI